MSGGPPVSPNNTQHQKHKRHIKARVKKWRQKTKNSEVASRSLDFINHILEGNDHSSDAPEPPVGNSVLESLYEKLQIDDEAKAMCKTLNTAVFPNPAEFRMDKGSNMPKAGSLQQLLLYLTDPDKDTTAFQKAFIITIPSFTKPNIVLAALFTRFYANPEEEGCNVSKEQLKKLRIRIIGIIQRDWIRYAKYQLEDPIMFEALDLFKQGAINLVGAAATVLVAALKQIKGEADKAVAKKAKDYDVSVPKDKPESEWKIIDLPEVECARQIKAFHQAQFMKITPLDLLASAWGGKAGAKAKAIEDMTNTFNDLSAYVAESVMFGSKDPHQRGRIVKKWIDIAYYCLDANIDTAPYDKFIDYQAVFSILCGITHRSVTRLQQTQKYAKRTNKIRQRHLQEMIDLTDIRGGFQKYRDSVKDATSCIPFMGAFQKDLVYITEFIPNNIDGLINFEKCEKATELILFVKMYQKHYGVKTIKSIQEQLEKLPPRFETIKLMEESRECEPDKKK